ncbi:epoxyqueuosine reductase QueH [Anaerocolumna sp. MB42-C2]|uniref:epoxyqueuosine reductase QueH n=1 Tax=Anaerocolumna sp. MB42-C2 TaxID=3070997 RepID=UPI0027DFDC25|nr:epoxyqueuosine reductase QueH [Anaerocolumna sp. MB42-C2]WMJ89834.1 epoxyqueuosine reductase QueH [Anaerocolumna sp. MB42-C2]
MDIQRNYQKELDKLISGLVINNKTPRLLLHSCCAPCSSYVLEYLSQFFRITIYYYNPNISFEEEYARRMEEQQRLIRELPVKNPIDFLKGSYEPERFYEIAKGLETSPEGSERCFRCYELRLTETAKLAKNKSYDYFTTTLSISPHKNAAKLNEIGEKLAQKYDIPYLIADFKKKNGYKRSIELSREYQLYRQDYCGCVYSKTNREASDIL